MCQSSMEEVIQNVFPHLPFIEQKDCSPRKRCYSGICQLGTHTQGQSSLDVLFWVNSLLTDSVLTTEAQVSHSDTVT